MDAIFGDKQVSHREYEIIDQRDILVPMSDGINLGVDVFLGPARFTGPKTVDVDGVELRFKRAVIATGARAV